MILATFLRSPIRFVGMLLGLVKDDREAVSADTSDKTIRGGETGSDSGWHSYATDGVPSLLSGAAGALVKIGPAAVPELIQVLRNDSNPEVRWGAAWALGEIGPAAAEAVADLCNALGERASLCGAGRQRSNAKNWRGCDSPVVHRPGR